MNLLCILILAFTFSSLAFTFAEDSVGTTTTTTKTVKETKPLELSSDVSKTRVKRTTRVEKNVKTNGKISTSGCETAEGKTIAENDFGYADCVKQIGLKK
jgi:hypothetical protein